MKALLLAAALVATAGCGSDDTPVVMPEPVTTPEQTTTVPPDPTTTAAAPTTTEPEAPPTTTAAPAPATTLRRTTTTARASQLAPVVHDVWWALALCEDGGRNRDFGPYSGYFHFLPSTYHAYGGTGQPSDDDYATQLAVAQRLQAAEGWWPWPGCKAKLGL